MLVLFTSFLFQTYAYLGEGECDVTAMGHVSETSHVAEVTVVYNCWHCQWPVALPTVDGIANSRWRCQQPMALTTVSGIANSRWHCQHLLASQVSREA